MRSVMGPEEGAHNTSDGRWRHVGGVTKWPQAARSCQSQTMDNPLDAA